MLKKKVDALEAQMREKLEEIRATFEHAGDKGAAVEDSFRKFLRDYLPRSMDIGHGEIIDTEGRRSKQTDIVIVNDDHPLTFTPDQPGLFFIEGVSVAGEVKTILTGTELENALNNSQAFKQLEASWGPHTLISTNPSDKKRFYEHRPWFLVAFDSQLTLPAIKNKAEAFKEARAIEDNGFLDAVFVLSRGSVINFGDGEGSLQYLTSEGTPIGGFVCEEYDSVLFYLLTWLSCVMPRIVRFEPILVKYTVPKDQRSS